MSAKVFRWSYSLKRFIKMSIASLSICYSGENWALESLYGLQGTGYAGM